MTRRNDLTTLAGLLQELRGIVGEFERYGESIGPKTVVPRVKHSGARLPQRARTDARRLPASPRRRSAPRGPSR